jgi:hypothetical protein
MDNQKNEISVAFIIYGHDDTSTLTQELGIQPDRALNKGEPLQPGAGPIPQSMWELKSKLSKDAPIEDHIDSLLQALRPLKDKILSVSKDHRTVIAVGARFYETNPEIELNPETLKELAGLNVFLWLDLYPQSA